MKLELLVFVGCFVKAVKESAAQLYLQWGGKEGGLASMLNEYHILHVAELCIVLIVIKVFNCSLTS